MIEELKKKKLSRELLFEEFERTVEAVNQFHGIDIGVQKLVTNKEI